MERNKNTSMKPAKPGQITSGLILRSGFVTGKQVASQKYVNRRFIMTCVRFGQGMSGDLS